MSLADIKYECSPRFCWLKRCSDNIVHVLLQDAHEHALLSRNTSVVLVLHLAGLAVHVAMHVVVHAPMARPRHYHVFLPHQAIHAHRVVTIMHHGRILELLSAGCGTHHLRALILMSEVVARRGTQSVLVRHRIAEDTLLLHLLLLLGDHLVLLVPIDKARQDTFTGAFAMILIAHEVASMRLTAMAAIKIKHWLPEIGLERSLVEDRRVS